MRCYKAARWHLSREKVMGGSSGPVWFFSSILKGGVCIIQIPFQIPSGAENRNSQPKCQSRAHQFLCLGKPSYYLEQVYFWAAHAQIPVRRMAPIEWESQVQFRGLVLKNLPLPYQVWMTQVLLHSRDKVKSESFESSPATRPNTLVEYIDSSSCRCLHFQREEIISFTENKGLLNIPELNCKSSLSSVLLKGGEETSGSVKQLGFPPSWLAPSPGSAQQAEKQLRHSSIQLVLRATLYPQEANSTDSACPCVVQNHFIPLDKQRFKGITYSSA